MLDWLSGKDIPQPGIPQMANGQIDSRNQTLRSSDDKDRPGLFFQAFCCLINLQVRKVDGLTKANLSMEEATRRGVEHPPIYFNCWLL